MKKWFWNIVIVLLVVIGLGLAFNSQITSWWVGFTGTQKAKHLTNQEVQNGNNEQASYNPKLVRSIDENAIAKSVNAQRKPAVGRIVIPAVNISLPIFKGLNDDDLTIGVGTMKPGEKMGEKNYVLAGHHLENPNVLFSPLSKTKAGQLIYLETPSQKFTYKIVSKKVVPESDISVINNHGSQKEVTLVTCASGQPGVTKRLIVRGVLVR